MRRPPNFSLPSTLFPNTTLFRSHLGTQVTSRGVHRLLGRFERNKKGLAPSLMHELAGRGDLLSRASLDLLRERLLPAIGDARRAADQLFLRLHGDRKSTRLNSSH